MSSPYDHSGSNAWQGFCAQQQRLRLEKYRVWLLGGGVFLALFMTSAHLSHFSPGRIAEGLPKVHEYVVKILPEMGVTTFRDDMAYWFYAFPDWMKLLGETLLMAYVATLLGTLGALVLGFVAARNVGPNRWLTALSRRVLEVARTVPDLVYALIFVFAFGLGPLAGILAIAVHSMGASGKLFSEAIENIDLKPLDGLKAAGGNWVQGMRFAIFPLVLPSLVSYSLWRFEINVRTATVMGIVGAGGIGQELITAIRMLYYEDVSALILLIVITVSLTDMLCERIRHGFIGKENLS
ncbi:MULTISPECIES: phosphonate ABC transporter, permease protein PhnE [unclassified Halomonas]|uniref:phosphonate ABC transporter, permease protein PhnE n=1 Tax=unclassified Halomonas TaxID=2609666 RepID=UPI001C63F588|nr:MULTISPECIES: phosphonate ABC transporter, permease protein PhnE [unclassified Halomonas]